jgi:hypothetical protein
VEGAVSLTHLGFRRVSSLLGYHRDAWFCLGRHGQSPLPLALVFLSLQV